MTDQPTGALRRSPNPGETFEAYRARMAIDEQARQREMWDAFLAFEPDTDGSEG